MQIWQIKALELEASVLKHLDGFIHEYPFYFLVGAIYLLLVLLARVLKHCGEREKNPRRTSQPVIFIYLPGPPPPPLETFDPFPPPRQSAHCDCDDEDWE